MILVVFLAGHHDDVKALPTGESLVVGEMPVSKMELRIFQLFRAHLQEAGEGPEFRGAGEKTDLPLPPNLRPAVGFCVGAHGGETYHVPPPIDLLRRAASVSQHRQSKPILETIHAPGSGGFSFDSVSFLRSHGGLPDSGPPYPQSSSIEMTASRS